jgi:diguanylate cyclase (GGDEF)-like protein
MPPALQTTVSQPRAGPTLTAVQLGGFAGAVALLVATAGQGSWRPGMLVAIAALAVASDLTATPAGFGKAQVSGTLLGVMLAAVLLGGGPGAVIGVVAVLAGWLRWREPVRGLAMNVVIYAWFPLLSGLFFHAVGRWLDVGSNDPAYYALILPTFALGLVVNFFAVAAYDCYRYGSSLLEKTREGLVPVLAAELFSAVLITAAVFFVGKTGTVGVVILGAVLAIFQYLVGELLKSKRRADELRRMATTDDLTGLANRERFNGALRERIVQARLAGESFGVMLIDLNHFKEINDTLGHHYGDVLLRDLGPRLAATIGEQGLVARLGGDEFAILPAERTGEPERLEQIATKLMACIREPMDVDELTLDIDASIGIARFPIDGEDSSDLLRRADVAMYSAKEQHAGHRLYTSNLDRHSARRFAVLTDFRRALASDQFVLHYQPMVDVEDARPRGAETLVRWEHPEIGLIPPTDFIPIAEQSGLIGPLTRYVLERAVTECAGWRAAGRDLIVSVNLSVRDLIDRNLPAEVSRVLTAHHLPPEALHLEITESMIMSDPERSLATVSRLRELGVRISVDDFGTGYSSLANLKQMPVSELKIDRSFISSMLQDESNLIIVRSTINLGHDLRLKVVAEGVEDRPTLNQLALLGCDFAQGYHLSKPLPGKQFIEWLDGVSAVDRAAVG